LAVTACFSATSTSSDFTSASVLGSATHGLLFRLFEK
jgi:hypothetical protein